MLMGGVARKKVLLIGMVDSVHVARWLRQFVDLPIDFTLFPATPNRRVHPGVEELIQQRDIEMSVTLPRVLRYSSLLIGVVDIFLSNRVKGKLLRRVALKGDFDVIHAQQLQAAGYIALRAFETHKPAMLISSCWGCDITWFSRFPSHADRLRRLIAITDCFSAECDRDVQLVRQMGYVGTVLPTIPVAGRLDVDRITMRYKALPPSQRGVILIKGYDQFLGLAPMALAALECIADDVREYRIVFYSTSRRMRRKVRQAALRTGLTIDTYQKHALGHEQMLELFSAARVYIGLSAGDGMPASMMEAMATGCYPIQTATSCADEWVSDTRSATLIHEPSVAAVAVALQEALTDDVLVDRAAQVNREAIRVRMRTVQIIPAIHHFYGY